MTTINPDSYRTAMIRRLGSSSPGHLWSPWSEQGVRRPGCSRCPDRSPFHMDQASHLYVIKEEP